MPQRYSGAKELRKSHKKHLHNLDIKSELKRTIKSFLKAVQEKNKTEAESGLKLVYKKLDKAAKRNIFHKNTASRRKSHYQRQLKSLEN